MVKGWFTTIEEWSYLAAIAFLTVGAIVLFRKSRSFLALLMSILVPLYFVGRIALQVANGQLLIARQTETPLEAASSPWWLAVYLSHALQFGGLALGCAAFLLFALEYKRDQARF